jgi:DUF917 family protein
MVALIRSPETLTAVAESDDDPPACVLHFKQIFTACKLDGAALAAVPYLISVLASDTGRTAGVEELEYGMRASVVAIASAPQLRTPEALAVDSPAAFGLGRPRAALPFTKQLDAPRYYCYNG